MGDQSELGPWANQVAEKYLGECEDLRTDQIVADLERTAYKLARDGKSKRAAKLFTAVADITNSSGDSLKWRQNKSLANISPLAGIGSLRQDANGVGNVDNHVTLRKARVLPDSYFGLAVDSQKSGPLAGRSPKRPPNCGAQGNVEKQRILKSRRVARYLS